MKDRVAFLHYLYKEASYDEITKATVLKSALDARIIGKTDKDRKATLKHFYYRFMSAFPRELAPVKKKPSFSFSTV